jgi:hypothetical protein
LTTSGLASPPRTQIVVSTFYALGNTDFHNVRMLVVLDPVAALGEKPLWAISHAFRARLFGFLPTNQRVAPYDRDDLTAVFGFDELTLRRHGYRERSVRCVRFRIGGGPPLAKEWGILELKRAAIWQHPVRNRQISHLAQALAAGDTRRIKELLPAAEPLLPPKRALHVAILVENLDHLLALSRHLPDWSLLAGSSLSLVGIHGMDRSRLERQLWNGVGLPDRAILTFSALKQTRVGRYDVLIRADGLSAIPDALEKLLITNAKRNYPLLLVDFQDQHHPLFRRWSRARQNEYHDRGWDTEDSPADVRMKQFLANRPECKK